MLRPRLQKWIRIINPFALDETLTNACGSESVGKLFAFDASKRVESIACIALALQLRPSSNEADLPPVNNG